MHLRCFIAIGMPEPIKREISEIIELMKKYDVDVKWVEMENIHITLKFLGKTPETLLPRIRKSLSTIALSYEPFYIKIYDIGMFPNRRYPRIIWIGVEDSEIVKRLQKDIEDSMESLGYQREDKEFHPHLTIGRVRSQKGMANLINQLDTFKGKNLGSIEVNNIKLMRSELRPTGAKYHCLYEIPFEGRRND